MTCRHIYSLRHFSTPWWSYRCDLMLSKQIQYKYVRDLCLYPTVFIIGWTVVMGTVYYTVISNKPIVINNHNTATITAFGQRFHLLPGVAIETNGFTSHQRPQTKYVKAWYWTHPYGSEPSPYVSLRNTKTVSPEATSSISSHCRSLARVRKAIYTISLIW